MAQCDVLPVEVNADIEAHPDKARLALRDLAKDIHSIRNKEVAQRISEGRRMNEVFSSSSWPSWIILTLGAVAVAICICLCCRYRRPLMALGLGLAPAMPMTQAHPHEPLNQPTHTAIYTATMGCLTLLLIFTFLALFSIITYACQMKRSDQDGLYLQLATSAGVHAIFLCPVVLPVHTLYRVGRPVLRSLSLTGPRTRARV